MTQQVLTAASTLILFDAALHLHLFDEMLLV